MTQRKFSESESGTWSGVRASCTGRRLGSVMAQRGPTRTSGPPSGCDSKALAVGAGAFRRPVGRTGRRSEHSVSRSRWAGAPATRWACGPGRMTRGRTGRSHGPRRPRPARAETRLLYAKPFVYLQADYSGPTRPVSLSSASDTVIAWADHHCQWWLNTESKFKFIFSLAGPALWRSQMPSRAQA